MGIISSLQIKKVMLTEVRQCVHSRAVISHEAGKRRQVITWLGWGRGSVEWKEKGTKCQRTLASCSARRLASDCSANGRVKRKLATGDGRKLQRPVGEILWIFEQKKFP